MGLPDNLLNQSCLYGVCAGLYQWIIDDAIRISGINGYEVRTGRNAGSVFLLQYKNK